MYIIHDIIIDDVCRRGWRSLREAAQTYMPLEPSRLVCVVLSLCLCLCCYAGHSGSPDVCVCNTLVCVCVCVFRRACPLSWRWEESNRT